MKRVRHDIHLYVEESILLAKIVDLLTKIDRKQDQTMASLQVIEDKVTENTTVVGSAVTLMEQLSAAIRDAAGDEAAVNALADRLDASTDALAAAVAANTPTPPTV